MLLEKIIIDAGVFKWVCQFWSLQAYFTNLLKIKFYVRPMVMKSFCYFYKVVSTWKLETVWGCVVICFEILKRWSCIHSQMGCQKSFKQSFCCAEATVILALLYFWLTWLPKRSQGPEHEDNWWVVREKHIPSHCTCRERVLSAKFSSELKLCFMYIVEEKMS